MFTTKTFIILIRTLRQKYMIIIVIYTQKTRTIWLFSQLYDNYIIFYFTLKLMQKIPTWGSIVPLTQLEQGHPIDPNWDLSKSCDNMPGVCEKGAFYPKNKDNYWTEADDEWYYKIWGIKPYLL